MTIIPFAAAVCHDCKAPVAIVRRTVEVPCNDCSRTTVCPEPGHTHYHAIPDCVWTVVDEDGIRHECATLTGVA